MSQKIGPKEQGLRDLRTDIPTFLRRGHPDCKFKSGPAPKTAKTKKNDGVTLAPPASIQKAIAADFAEEPTDGGSDFPDRSDAVKQREFNDNAKTPEATAPVMQQENAMLTETETTTTEIEKPKKTATPKAAKTSKKTSKKSAKSKARTRVKSKSTTSGDSKKATVLAMLKKGATMDELTKATGWTPHSVHGLIGSIRSKMKLKVVATKEKDVNVYRIAA
jgi:hypothetical protein